VIDRSRATPVLMMVHAHPDDESSLTGGTLARYSAAGVRTILVTCTDGGQGDDGPGLTAGSPGHDPHRVAARRSVELDSAAALLGVNSVIRLGYPDSGMSGHPSGTVEACTFSRRPIRPMVERLVRLMRLHQPDAVVTYPPDGLSGHADHIRTHDIVTAAHRNIIANQEPVAGRPTRSRWRPTLYHIALSSARMRVLRGLAADVRDMSTWVPSEGVGVDAADITTVIDIGAFIPQKLKALAAHTSQGDALVLLRLLAAASSPILQFEEYVQAYPAPLADAQLRRDDLFEAVSDTSYSGREQGTPPT
jgi:LmbE family N-acetylglucosaminyl deacetylase